jgi:hypothetical protein
MDLYHKFRKQKTYTIDSPHGSLSLEKKNTIDFLNHYPEQPFSLSTQSNSKRPRSSSYP